MGRISTGRGYQNKSGIVCLLGYEAEGRDVFGNIPFSDNGRINITVPLHEVRYLRGCASLVNNSVF